MSKPIKELIIDAYREQLGALEGALLVDIRGIEANDNNEMRNGLHKKAIRVTVLKNTLARKAFSGTALEPLSPLMEGPSAVVYGAETVVDVARELVEWARKLQELDLKGAVLEGELFEGLEGVKRLSLMPTREEAQARVVQLLLTPGGNVVGAAISPGSRILAVVKEIQERHERGEAIAKVA